MSDLRVYSKQQSISRATDDTWVALRATRDGSPIVTPWLTALALEGKVYQVRVGTITTPITGDVLITDTAAEAAASPPTGTTIIPVSLQFTFEAITTLADIAAKSVGAIHTAQTTVFLPLNLRIGGGAATSTAGVGTAGGVTVAAEAVTTTRVHYVSVSATAADAPTCADKEFTVPPILVGPSCFYVQIAGPVTAPTYFGNFNFVELVTTDVT